MNKRDFLARLLGMSAVAVVAKVEAKEEKSSVVATPIPDPGMKVYNGNPYCTTTYNPYWKDRKFGFISIHGESTTEGENIIDNSEISKLLKEKYEKGRLS